MGPNVCDPFSLDSVRIVVNKMVHRAQRPELADIDSL